MSEAETVNYEELLQTYQKSLVDVLRGQSVGASYLELWVPDEDPVKSLLNMVEAAQAAGRDDIAIEVSRKTLDARQAGSFDLLAREHGAVTVEPWGAGFRLHVSGLQEKPASLAGTLAKLNGQPVVSEARSARARTTVEARQPLGSVDPTSLEINPALKDAVAAAGRTITHEGKIAPADGLQLLDVTNDTGKLALLVDPQSHQIRAARHRDVRTPERRTILDLFCRIAEGRTVQDASDHVGIVAVHDLGHEPGKKAVAGIMLPKNAGRAFVDCLSLVRLARAEYARRTGDSTTENFFELPPGAGWSGLSREQKAALASARIAEFSRAHKLPDGAIHLDRLEKDLLGHEIRVVVGFDDAVEPWQKPQLLRALELEFKTLVDDKLQLYLEPLKDQNKLRRL